MASYGQEFTDTELSKGEYINLPRVGRYGFYVVSTTNSPYKIYSEFGSDITDTFDYTYQGDSAYYVSKEFSTPVVVYFKIEKI